MQGEQYPNEFYDHLDFVSQEATKKSELLPLVEDPAIESQIAVAVLAEIAHKSDRLLHSIGYAAIANGYMSQRELAEHLNVSEATMSRNYGVWRREQSTTERSSTDGSSPR